MKSVYIHILLLLLSLALISCQAQETKSEEKQAVESAETPAAAEGKIHRVGVADFMAAMSEDMQLVDVRTPEEFEAGHIETAINYNVNGADFDKEVAGLDKSKPVLLYCKMGGRSARAAKKLQEMGFSTIYDLEGGYTAWSKQ